MTIIRGPLTRSADAVSARLLELANQLESPYAAQVFVAKDFTKADLIRALREVAAHSSRMALQFGGDF